jgi:hypothetical protein
MRDLHLIWAGSIVLGVAVVSSGACGSDTTTNATANTTDGGGTPSSTAANPGTGGHNPQGAGGHNPAGTGGDNPASTTGPGGGTPTGTGGSAAGTGGSAAGTGGAGGGTTSGGGGSGGAGCVELTVQNVDNWCTITVEGVTALPGANPAPICVAPGTVVQMSVTADSGFKLGDWHNDDGDTGNGDPGNLSMSDTRSSVEVTVGDSATCVWVCCPGTGALSNLTCPSTDPTCTN